MSFTNNFYLSYNYSTYHARMNLLAYLTSFLIRFYPIWGRKYLVIIYAPSGQHDTVPSEEKEVFKCRNSLLDWLFKTCVFLSV